MAKPATMQAFRAELGQQGFDHAVEIYAAMKKESPEFKLDEQMLNSWACEIMADHLPEATELLKLNVALYPDSGNAYDSLGEAYMKAGQKDLAIANYKKSLEKDPTNTNAVEKLKELGVGALRASSSSGDGYCMGKMMRRISLGSSSHSKSMPSLRPSFAGSQVIGFCLGSLFELRGTKTRTDGASSGATVHLSSDPQTVRSMRNAGLS
jgi:tetratricopeptide (TPR) repeat protein